MLKEEVPFQKIKIVEGIDLIIRTDTADLADMEILKANTGSQVFLEVHLTFCDAMEDLSLKISM
nr:hypothetical protein [uncultured Oscillibacter sp.]